MDWATTDALCWFAIKIWTDSVWMKTPLVPKILLTLIVVWILPWLFRDLRLRGPKGYVSLRLMRYGEGNLWPLTLHQDWHPNHASNDCDCLKEPGGVIMWIMDKICALSHSLYYLFFFLQLSYSSLPGVWFLDNYGSFNTLFSAQIFLLLTFSMMLLFYEQTTVKVD